MTKKKKIILISIAGFLVLAILGTTLGLYFGIYRDPHKGKYKDERAEYVFALAQCDFYDNINSPYPSTFAWNQMHKHFYENESGKTPMLLFLGYDGCLATGIALRENAENSAAFTLGKQGGMYLTRTGGADPVNKYAQATSTAPGWAAIFTGKWATENGVRTNGGVLKTSTESLMYSLAKDNIPTSFTVSWASHLNTTYKKEVASAKKNNYPATYKLCDDDEGTYNNLVDRITNSNDRAIFCTLEYTDHEGHGTGFSLKNEKYVQAVNDIDSVSYELIQKVYSRPTYTSEDWMIVIASDHGGVSTAHGGGTVMEYTTFYISNKKPV